ncbi:MAG: hypothetical protein ACREGJ_04025 [Candidatus Saccharimonadales bacterium]
MRNIRILIIAPYPIIDAQHGGQKRAKALFDFYAKNYQAVKFTSVFHRGQYPAWGEDDLPLGDPEIIAEVDKHPYASELICGEAIDKDIHVRSYLAKLLVEFRPDIIHIEQPFAYLGLKQLLAELKLKPLIIFGSQNIEYPLKARIFKELNVPKKLSDELIQKTKDLEFALSREASLLVAVNHEDAESHKEMGAKRITIAPNGIENSTAPYDDLEYWKKFKEREGINSIFVFVGSGHPPNWEGFLELIGDDTTFLPEDSKIIIAGGVSDYFNAKFSDPRDKFWASVRTVGRLEEGRLAALLRSSDQILLPITTKRGSNLKTAEAILAQKKIIATSNTFHGFEEYVRLPNIFIGDNKEQFKKAMLQALAKPYRHLKKEEKSLVERVQWSYRLKPIKRAVDGLIINKRAKKIIRKLLRG